MPPFTVIIATHDRPVLLRRAIASVKDQGSGLAHLVVVSDSRCERTFQLATSLLDDGDRFVQRAGAPGPAESRNVALRLAEGRFVLFLDDDDALPPRFLQDALVHARDDRVIYTDFVSIFEQRQGEIAVAVSGERRSLAAVDTDAVTTEDIGSLMSRVREPDWHVQCTIRALQALVASSGRA